ncbi:TetR/AcrR family transcriptional regulator [Mycobacterium sp. Aquia_213]|uniref:TetR/AcrR family transcriptional regulator n=1 Tax=Mycobacterium sp. Aquia_213 TaxID=2991728 RepID=UPI002270C612|nr:TetR/AcrR family transcriptional regulator [Mycobacterium sp. Aquia_213]WAC94109.1 TetR/AcrR family transcriptional regulator [Mycobacterium sp. Aquia_213]
MSRDDWLVGGDRRKVAIERIYAAATEMITRNGPDGFDIDTLAKRVHCSRATIYRYVGGKAEIRDAVITRAASRIVETVRQSVQNISGAERAVTAITVALRLIRADPLYQLMIRPVRAGDIAWFTGSPLLAGFAKELTGLTDGDAHGAQWVVRVVLSLMYWPVGDHEDERELVQRFVAPAFTSLGATPLLVAESGVELG